MKQEKIWDYYQNEALESFKGSVPRLKYLLSKFKSGCKILNIGVGGGLLERLALEKNIDIYSLDPNEKTIKRLKSILGQNKAKVGYSHNIPYNNNFFDGVIMTEVLEHLSDEAIHKTLKEVSRILKKDGKFIGTVPFNENLSSQIVICPYCGEKFHRWGHIQSFDKERINMLLKEAFAEYCSKEKMFVSWDTLNIKGKLGIFVNYILYLIGIKKSGLNLYFYAAKKKQ